MRLASASDDVRPTPGRRLTFALFAGLLLLSQAALFSATAPASALSELNPETPSAPGTGDETAPGITIPPMEGPDEPQEEQDLAHPDIEPDGPPPEIIYNLDRLPEPVRRMHRLMLEATKSGDIERLRPLIGLGDNATQLSFGGVDGDPVSFLKGLSGDPEGQEILAILEEVLSAGYVHLDAGTAEELYVWPYFFAIPLDKLTPPQRVELFKIVTASDYDDMKAFGSYIFYRVGIDPEGRWAFFVAGD
jgi:hypothetical protein